MMLRPTGEPRAPPWPSYPGTAQKRAQNVARQVVALQLHAANELASGAGCRLRLVRRNGRDLIVTADFDPRRINIETEADIVGGESLG